MQPNHRAAIHVIACGMMWFQVLFFFPESAFSQDDSTPPRTLQVGVIVAPPAYINKALLKFLKTENWTELQNRYLK